MDDRTHGRRIGRFITPALVSLALVLGACSSGTPETTAAEESPAPLALDDSDAVADSATDSDETADTSPVGDDAVETIAASDFEVSEFSELSDLENVELTPALFEELKVNESSRAAILVEMQNQGLNDEQAVCFLDTVSPELFIVFGAGGQPDDAQLGELIELLNTCGIAIG